MPTPTVAAVGTTASGTTTCSPTIPAGVVNGSLVILFGSNAAGTTNLTPPAGFGEVVIYTTAAPALKAWWKRATGSESGSYTVSGGIGASVGGFAMRITGDDGSSAPFGVATDSDRATATTTGPSVDLPSVLADSLVIHAMAVASGRSFTASSGFTLQSATGTQRLMAATKSQASAGSSGTVNGSVSGANTDITSVLFFVEGVVEGTGSAAGTGTASGVGGSTAATTGTGSGVAAATGTGGSVVAGTGSSAGSGTATGAAASITAATGSAAGTAAATGAGGAIDAATGSSSGSGSASAGSGSVTAGEGDADGSADVDGVAGSTAAGTGTAAGTSTVDAQSGTVVGGTGTSSGSSTATGTTGTLAAGAGSAAGTAAVGGQGGATAAGIGSAAGTATADAVGQRAVPPKHYVVTAREVVRTSSVRQVGRTRAAAEQSRKTTVLEGIA